MFKIKRSENTQLYNKLTAGLDFKLSHMSPEGLVEVAEHCGKKYAVIKSYSGDYTDYLYCSKLTTLDKVFLLISQLESNGNKAGFTFLVPHSSNISKITRIVSCRSESEEYTRELYLNDPPHWWQLNDEHTIIYPIQLMNDEEWSAQFPDARIRWVGHFIGGTKFGIDDWYNYVDQGEI